MQLKKNNVTRLFGPVMAEYLSLPIWLMVNDPMRMRAVALASFGKWNEIALDIPINPSNYQRH